MAQERIDDTPVMSSLQKAPDGRLFDSHARDSQLRAQSTIERRNPPQWVGPRDDAIPTHNLPTVTRGLEPMPTTCQFCGSGLAIDHGVDGGPGRIMCQSPTCGRQVAWLKSVTMLSRPLPPAPTIQPIVYRRPIDPIIARRPIRSRLFNRAAGCGRGCSIEYGHDPESHESFGRESMRRELAAKPSGIVISGPITIDLDTETCTVRGNVVAFTATELRILLYLAARVGAACRHRDIVTAVWDEDTAVQWALPRHGYKQWSAYRTFLYRLRGKLGNAAVQVETVMHTGVRLRSDDATV